jgi:hypothetical protein
MRPMRQHRVKNVAWRRIEEGTIFVTPGIHFS